MIEFIKSIELDKTIENLLMSMVQVRNYLDSVLEFNEKVLTPKKERELIKILKKYNIPHDNLQYNPKILTENPYYRDIKLIDVKSKTVRYEKSTIKKRTLMSMGFHRPLGKYLFHYHPLGYFEEEVDLPALKQGDNKVWMSPAISEIDSMGDGIKKGHGNCMTMGLGIGVLPYLWLLKDNVNSVTVIEFNQDVIELFEKYILPQFNTDKPLKIIHGDAINYYNKEFLNEFDYAYIDFWESSEDGLEMYIKLLEKNIDFSQLPPVDFWLEDAMLHDVKYIITLYLSARYQDKDITGFISSLDEDTKKLAKKANRYFKSKNKLISTEDDLLYIIHNKDVLRKILAQ